MLQLTLNTVKSSVEVIIDNGGMKDIYVTIDVGDERLHTCLNGVITVTSADTCKGIDYEVLFNTVHVRITKIFTQKTIWPINYSGTSGVADQGVRISLIDFLVNLTFVMFNI